MLVTLTHSLIHQMSVECLLRATHWEQTPVNTTHAKSTLKN